ncbi:MAG: hypothetical protein P1V81_14525 [Planctomycetota bacterium]|nr:hypothetical protein [Planctomycetota bacterium]
MSRALPRSSLLTAPLALGLIALAFYLALPLERYFSDSFYLVDRVEVGAPPYYNVAYVPLGRLVDLALGSWLGTERALEVLSALAAAGAVGLTVGIARRLGLGGLGQAATGLLLLGAPGCLFFAGVIEVHAVQLFGAALSLRLALAAGDARGALAWLLFATAALVAMTTHLSHLLWLPGLWVLAWGRAAEEPGPGGMFARESEERVGLGFGQAGVPWLLGLGLVLTVVVVLLVRADFGTWSVHPALQWLGTLIVFGRQFVFSLWDRGLFTFGESVDYLSVELLGAHGLLVLGFAAGLWSSFTLPDGRCRRLARRGLVATLPALLILPQGGVLEHGGYFLTLAPLMALQLGILFGSPRPGITPVSVAALLVLAQLALGLRGWAEFRSAEPDARDWSVRVAAQLQPGDSVLVSTLGRTFSLADERPDVRVRDLARDLAMEPDRGRARLLKSVLNQRLTDPAFPGDLWLDGDLLPGFDPAVPLAEGVPAWQQELFAQLLAAPVPVQVRGETDFELIRIVRR